MTKKFTLLIYAPITAALLLCFAGFSSAQTTITEGTKTIVTFTSGTTNWEVPNGVTHVDVFIVAGGGGGGSRSRASGGGGGGGVIIQTINVIPEQSYPIVVGGGGAGGASNVAGQRGANGGNSSAFGLTSFGGGGGGGYTNVSGGNPAINNGASGGSGGGAGGNYSSNVASIPGTGSQGNNGGHYFYNSNNGSGGGGGGAGGPGGNATSNSNPGAGGNGIIYNGVEYAKGGIGGVSNPNTATAGASGGANTGNGGGGARGTSQVAGGNGGSGIVIISYTAAYAAEFISMNTGPSSWCAGETREVSVTVKNVGQATWTNGAGGTPVVNIGVKWNTDDDSWDDYHVRTSANNLAPGQTGTYYFTVPAIKSEGYTLLYNTPLDPGTNNLTFDVVYEGNCWFGDNNGSCGPGNAVFTSAVITINTYPTFTYSKSNPTCFGASNGSITIHASGGSGQYEYSKDGGTNWQDGNIFNGLQADDYILQVKDKITGCVQTECIEP